jgi:hypothetical protein
MKTINQGSGVLTVRHHAVTQLDGTPFDVAAHGWNVSSYYAATPSEQKRLDLLAFDAVRKGEAVAS